MSVARQPCLALLRPYTAPRRSPIHVCWRAVHYSSTSSSINHSQSSRSPPTRPPAAAAGPHTLRPSISNRKPVNEASKLSKNARRHFSTSPIVRHGHLTPPKPGEELRITFIDKDNSEHTFQVAAGDNLLDIAQAEELEMEGACGGSCACSTCHVIVEENENTSYYDLIPEPSDDENDMLDLAFGLTETSRLGCQVKMAKELDGLRVRLPSMTRNLQASDFSGAKKE